MKATENVRCGTCVFGLMRVLRSGQPDEKIFIACSRYPKTITKSSWHVCGEWSDEYPTKIKKEL